MQAQPSSLALLDNPVWSALEREQQLYAERLGAAVRYRSEYTPFVALEHASAAADRDLHDLITPNEVVYLFCPHDRISSDRWTIEARVLVHQAILSSPGHLVNEDGTRTGLRVVHPSPEEVYEITRVAFPDFFRTRTYELGRYWGLVEGGRLLATGGERMRVSNTLQEISTVCCLPEHRRQGLARMLLTYITARLVDEGKTPYAHIVESNLASLNLFQKLGYRVRATIPMLKLRRRQ